MMTRPRSEQASSLYRVHVDGALCDGCGVCIFYCKPRVFALSRALNSRGFFVARPEQDEACTGCRLCELGCPQLAIALRRCWEGAR